MRTLPWLALTLAGTIACDEPKPSPPPRPSVTAARRTSAAVEIRTVAKTGSLSEVFEREAEDAKRSGRTLLVYVGAPWCEPCQHFKTAVKRGDLDTEFPGLRLLELDRDVDEARLAEAGCLSRLIPLLARPVAGRCSATARMEGSIKGPGAVAEMTPRLRTLLATP
ncbi:MAG: thioredoxin family protein [Polyangiaceae bacterium]